MVSTLFSPCTGGRGELPRHAAGFHAGAQGGGRHAEPAQAVSNACSSGIPSCDQKHCMASCMCAHVMETACHQLQVSLRHLASLQHPWPPVHEHKVHVQVDSTAGAHRGRCKACPPGQQRRRRRHSGRQPSQRQAGGPAAGCGARCFAAQHAARPVAAAAGDVSAVRVFTVFQY